MNAWKRALVCGVGTGLMAAVSALSGVPAQAVSGASEQLVLTKVNDTTPLDWSACGAFSDGGSWSIDKFNPDAPKAPTYQVTTTQTGAGGTFRVRFQQHFVAGAASWQILGGTGAYSHLQGNGTWTTENDGLHFTLTGTVHYSGPAGTPC